MTRTAPKYRSLRNTGTDSSTDTSSTSTSVSATKRRSTTALRAVLVALGGISAFVALNMALGGLDTLGWQGPTDYVQVTDPDGFSIRDSHARFYGGVYAGIAAMLVIASADIVKYRQTLSFVFALIFLGGLARLSQGELNVMFGPELFTSSVVELVGMPAMLLWLRHLTAPNRRKVNGQQS
jgi:hypothetical protein